MGFLDVFDIFNNENDDSTYGYKSFKNTKGWTNADMLEKLASCEDTFGAPKMGWIRAFGKEREVVVFDRVHEVNYIYVDAQPKKIIVSMAPKPGQVGGAVDHILPEDVGEKKKDFVGATMDAMDAANEMIKIVKGLLEK